MFLAPRLLLCRFSLRRDLVCLIAAFKSKQDHHMFKCKNVSFLLIYPVRESLNCAYSPYDKHVGT